MNGPNNPISWCDWTWNPVKGLCPVNCSYCYARTIYNRFHYDPTIRMDEKELQAPFKLKEPSKIFVGSTIELFGNWVLDKWRYDILQVVKANPKHIFQFLTKYPQWMKLWRFPDNCWCGSTITSLFDTKKISELAHVKAKKHFISFEPLHSEMYFLLPNLYFCDWFIIGAETGNRKSKIMPQENWIGNILRYADANDIPVFMKDNLKPYWHGELRQELP